MKRMMWTSSRQVRLLCSWEMHLTELPPHLSGWTSGSFTRKQYDQDHCVSCSR